MSRYPEYRAHRSSFGIDVLETLVVEVESDDGQIGFGVSTGGVPASYLVERHLAHFFEGKRIDQIELIWDQMWRAGLFTAGRGWLCMRSRRSISRSGTCSGAVGERPVYALLGGAVRDEIDLYATGPRPDVAKELDFVGGKVPLSRTGPASVSQAYGATWSRQRS
jgi:L-rhamnonate dehydratase